MKFSIIVISLFTVLSCCPDQRQNYPDGITASKIRLIEIGMSKTDVINILGQPLMKTPQTHYTYKPFNKDTTIVFKEGLTFQYTKRLEECNYPMLWVHFDTTENKELNVSSVYAKHYNWFDDMGIYGVSKNDKTGKQTSWERDAFEELFKE